MKRSSFGTPCSGVLKLSEGKEKMAVIFDPDGSVFTIHTDHTTYQMQADRLGHLLHLYYGRRSSGRMDYLLTYADRGFSPNPYEAGMDRTYSLDVLPQEFPVQGSGGFRSPQPCP